MYAPVLIMWYEVQSDLRVGCCSAADAAADATARAAVARGRAAVALGQDVTGQMTGLGRRQRDPCISKEGILPPSPGPPPVTSRVVQRNRATLPQSMDLVGDRHGSEVPKFVFMAVGFETFGHASRMAHLTTLSVEPPPTYILLKFKKLNISPSTRPQLGPTFENATTLIQTMAGLRAALPNVCCCVIWNTTDRTISIRFI